MQVICLDEAAYFALIDKVMDYVRQTHNVKEDKWISGEEAMKKLRITSKTTLQTFKNFTYESVSGYLLVNRNTRDRQFHK